MHPVISVVLASLANGEYWEARLSLITLMEELGQQDADGMGLDSTTNDNKGDKGKYPQNLQSHHDILMICSFCVPPDNEN